MPTVIEKGAKDVTRIEADVVIVGGGPAGLAAALAARDKGADVALLEAAPVFGGTAAWSGGAAWVPMNAHELAAGTPDSREQAFAYMRHCAEGTGNDALFATYLDAGPEVVTFLERVTPLELTVGTMPDYQAGVEGGVTAPGHSRSVAPATFDLNRLGDQRALARRSPHGTMPYSFPEFEEMGVTIHPERIDWSDYQARIGQGLVGWGEALAAGLLAGVLENGIATFPETRGRELIVDRGVRGVRADQRDGAIEFIARKGVVLATGGFEWNSEEMAQHFPCPIEPATVPTNRGDGLAMARSAGAALGNMEGMWGWPSYTIPGEVQDDEGHPLVRTSLIERLLPHMICINGNGDRFADETISYHRLLKMMLARDAQGKFPNLPAFHLFDRQYRERYAFGPVFPGGDDPEWLVGYPSLAALAAAIGVPADRLKQTVADYNTSVRQGRDERFHRGSGGYAAFFGDRDNHPTPNLGTIEQAPFYAIPMLPGTIGTCGGPRFDGLARVLGAGDVPIEGLYAAGNVTAAFSGPSYFGPGGTLGPALIFGVIAGRSAATRDVEHD